MQFPRTFFLLSVSVFLLALASAPADAKCRRGTVELNLKDNSNGCVFAVETTQITYSQSVVGGGPAAARKSAHDAGVVAMHFLSEKDARSLRLKSVNARAKEVCQRYRSELLAKVAKPGNPFMVAIFSWGSKPEKNKNGRSPTYREIYMTKNCWVKEHK